MIKSDRHQKNKQTILTTLRENKNQLIFLELKKKSKLPNLYFFKALEALEKENVILRFKKHSEMWIKIDQVSE